MMDRKPYDELSRLVARVQSDVSRIHALATFSSLNHIEHQTLVGAGVTLSHVTKDWADGSAFKRLEAAE